MRKVKFSVLQEEWIRVGNLSAAKGFFINLGFPLVKRDPRHRSEASSTPKCLRDPGP